MRAGLARSVRVGAGAGGVHRVAGGVGEGGGRRAEAGEGVEQRGHGVRRRGVRVGYSAEKQYTPRFYGFVSDKCKSAVMPKCGSASAPLWRLRIRYCGVSKSGPPCNVRISPRPVQSGTTGAGVTTLSYNYARAIIRSLITDLP